MSLRIVRNVIFLFIEIRLKESILMENNGFTLDEIERAAEFYCSDCCYSCDECLLHDFIFFDLSRCLHEVTQNE